MTTKIVKNEKIPYKQAFGELQQIVKDLENEEVEVDELVSKLKRAGSLLKICKSKLSETENQAAELLKTMNED